MARVESLVTDEPLVVDGIVVHERERHRHAHGYVDLRGLEVRVVDPDPDLRRKAGGVSRRAGARRKRGERQRDEDAKDHAETVCDRRKSTMAPSAASAMPMSATGSVLDLEGVVVALAGASSPAATRDGLAPLASTARAYGSWLADALIASFVSQPDCGIQSIPLSERRALSSDTVAGALWSRRMPLPNGYGSSAGR